MEGLGEFDSTDRGNVVLQNIVHPVKDGAAFFAETVRLPDESARFVELEQLKCRSYSVQKYNLIQIRPPAAE
jgi:hypothetical protein